MWRQLLIDTVIRPRAGAQQVLGFGIAPGSLLLATVAVTCLAVVLGFSALMIQPGGAGAIGATMFRHPVAIAVIQLCVTLVIAVLTFRIGQFFGGGGGFWDSLAVVTWLNAVMLIFQVAQIAVIVLLPRVDGLVTVAALAWFLWAYSSFVAELHGFGHPVKVLGVTVLGMVFLFFGVATLLAIFGVTPQGGG